MPESRNFVEQQSNPKQHNTFFVLLKKKCRCCTIANCLFLIYKQVNFQLNKISVSNFCVKMGGAATLQEKKKSMI